MAASPRRSPALQRRSQRGPWRRGWADNRALARRPQPVMADAPFLAIAVAEQARGGVEEETPAPMPKRRVGAIEAAQHLVDRRRVAVEVLQPMIGGALVMRAVPPPFLFDRDEIVELADEALARHDAAGEKMLRDPVGAVAGIEAIGRTPVAEDVQKERALRRQP